MARRKSEVPVPMKLYAQKPNGKARTFIGEAYTLDAATEAIRDEDWPATKSGELYDAVLIDGDDALIWNDLEAEWEKL